MTAALLVADHRRVRLLSGRSSPLGTNLEHDQTAFEPLLYGVGVAIVLTLFLKETGPATRRLAA
jgi:hypothetical protein